MQSCKMHPPRICTSLLAQFRSLTLQSSRPTLPPSLLPTRSFSTTSPSLNWRMPRRRTRPGKTQKGRPQVNTGGSTRGTSVAYGSWGLRLLSNGLRVSAMHFRIAEEALKRRLKGHAAYIYPRVTTNVAVYTSGNEHRMGKGKGNFDYWCARVAHGRIVLEVGGEVHEQIVREALRVAGNKLPGKWEFVRKEDGPVVGTHRLKSASGLTREDLFRPRRKEPLHPLHRLADGSRAGDVQSKVTTPEPHEVSL